MSALTPLIDPPSPKRKPRLAPLRRPRVQMSEGAAAAGAGAATAAAVHLRPSLATLLAGHILRDGEIVLLILKPSLWLIVFNGMRFNAVVLIGLIAGQLWLPDRLPDHVARSLTEVAATLIVLRVMWSILQWMGRLYVLTDLRILRLSGVFNIEIFDCALRKVAETRLTRNFRERVLRLGSIEITPSGDRAVSPGVWQTISKPAEVLAKIRSTIDRAKQGDCGMG